MTLTGKLATDLATRLMDAAIEKLTDAEMDAILRGGPGDWNLTDCTTDELHRLEAGEDPEAVLDPSRRNPWTS